ncbi:uncharacterized protein LOC129591499 [Paramacrobiotus metropolitanus]|uniref:uncharacterized protein LOC129591499 n=1 Tax=Paramacrobiotus metropolitanus TaxID=2943436 RepID=UPI0024462EE1|nr:uncharacterized protein LOC129591499 [Paramacrobiotus metropolitanus]
MDYRVFLVFLAISCSFFAYAALSPACEELHKQCRDHLAKERPEVVKMETLAPGSNATWPVTEGTLQEYRDRGDAYCRRVNESAVYLKDLFNRCPGFQDQRNLLADYFTWYDFEMRMVFARLCGTTVGPVKFFRAVKHCSKHGLRLFWACCEPNYLEDHDVERNATAPTAHRKICQTIQKVMGRISGPRGQEMSGKCGQDAVDAIKKAYTELYPVHCLN